MKIDTPRRPLRSHMTGATPLSFLWLIPVLLLAALAATFLFYEGRKAYLDYRVRDLCAKDGGVKVYETVKLPADEYDRYKRRNWTLPDMAQARPEDKYYVETDRSYYRKGNPEMSRKQHRIIRRSDGKVLAELVRYGRGGGDLPGPWHGSSFSCPDPTRAPNFESSVFVRGDAK